MRLNFNCIKLPVKKITITAVPNLVFYTVNGEIEPNTEKAIVKEKFYAKDIPDIKKFTDLKKVSERHARNKGHDNVKSV
jgi:hypothetical protein